VFIQVIKAKVKDREGVKRLSDRWLSELRPGAEGFLGATIGITDDGTLVDVARFESRGAAMANSARPEQGAWWAEFEACLEGPAEFRESEDVTISGHGDFDQAGFVQVMEGRLRDVEAARAFAAEMVDTFEDERPDVFGDVQIIHPDSTFTDVVYFASEAAAREGEAATPSPAMQEAMTRMGELLEVDSYYDLRDPWLA
jgi:hypothetical protein